MLRTGRVRPAILGVALIPLLAGVVRGTAATSTRGGQQLVALDRGATTNALADYLAAHHQTAEAYVVGLFETRDVVFLGESHQTRQRELFLQRLIPLLYKAGVRTLGYEMACSEDQAAIDALVSAPAYDEAAAFTLLAHWDFSWPLQEYADVYRAAWQLNHSLPPGAPRFRILGIDIRPDFHRLPAGVDPMPALRPQVDPKAAEELRGLIVGGSDRDLVRNTRMAEILRREVVSKGQKALMFNGSGHSTTKYLRPARSGPGKRMVVGYMIHQEIGARAVGVLLRGPSAPGTDPIPDAVAIGLGPGEESLGFTTRGSPVGAMTVTAGKETLRMEDFWDGLVFVSMKTPWKPATANFRYLTDEAVKRAKAEGSLPDLPAITVDSLKKDVLDSLARVAAQIKKGTGF